jgi:hypothetical protein
MPQTVLDLLTTWGAFFGHGLAKKVWRLVPHSVLWSIWRERNARLFEDVETVMVVLRKRVLNTLYLWIASLPPRCFYFCRLSKFISCSSRLGALLYTSSVLGLRPSALFIEFEIT